MDCVKEDQFQSHVFYKSLLEELNDIRKKMDNNSSIPDHIVNRFARSLDGAIELLEDEIYKEVKE